VDSPIEAPDAGAAVDVPQFIARLESTAAALADVAALADEKAAALVALRDEVDGLFDKIDNALVYVCGRKVARHRELQAVRTCLATMRALLIADFQRQARDARRLAATAGN
jgi:hypothetical protein